VAALIALQRFSLTTCKRIYPIKLLHVQQHNSICRILEAYIMLSISIR
jgi:hypothetical protein